MTYGEALAAWGGDLVDTLGAVEARVDLAHGQSRLTVTAGPALAARTLVVVHQLNTVAGAGSKTRLRQTLIHVRLTTCPNEPETHIQPFYGSLDFVRDYPGEPVPVETFTYSHLSWSSIVPYLLHPSNTIHGILPVQSTRLTVFFYNLSPRFMWSTSWPGTLHFILHTFLHPIIVFFSQQMPIPCPRHIQPFYDSLDFVRDNPGKPVPEETLTDSHQSWSSIILHRPL